MGHFKLKKPAVDTWFDLEGLSRRSATPRCQVARALPRADGFEHHFCADWLLVMLAPFLPIRSLLHLSAASTSLKALFIKTVQLRLNMDPSKEMTAQEFNGVISLFNKPVVAGGLTLDPCRRHKGASIRDLDLQSKNLSFLCLSDCAFLTDEMVHTVFGFEAIECLSCKYQRFEGVDATTLSLPCKSIFILPFSTPEPNPKKIPPFSVYSAENKCSRQSKPASWILFSPLSFLC